MRRLFLIIIILGLFNAISFQGKSFAQERKANTNRIYSYKESEIIKFIFLSKSAVLRGVGYSNSKPNVMYALKDIGNNQNRMFEISATNCEGYGYNCSGLKICVEPKLDIDRNKLSKLEKKYNFEKNEITISFGVDYKNIDGKNKLVIQNYQLCRTISMKNGLTEKEINKPIIEFTNIAEEVLKISYPFKGDKIVK